MQDSLLYERSATRPDTSGGFPRPRIHKLMERAMECPLITVSSGAGWGKTQAVSAFLSRFDSCVAWRRLSPLDNFSVRFWESFIYAVGVNNPKLSAVLARIDFPGTIPSFHNFLHLWMERMTETERFVLVFDDFHHISEPAVIRFVENILCAQLKSLTVILIGRTFPVLAPRGFYTGESLYGITQADLRFTEEETAGYYASRGLSLSGEVLAHIQRKTEGWISAIGLMGMAIQEKTADIRDALVIAERQIFELIRQEVFPGYSEEARQALIQLAFLTGVPADAIKECLYSNLEALEEIESKNQLIRLNPVTRTYDMHHLFLDFLLEKQGRLPERERQEMYGKVADWYHARGQLIDALAYYRQCGRHDQIWEILSHYGIAIPPDSADMFLKLLDGFPADFVKERPLVRVVHARLLLNNGRIEASRSEFLDIIRTCEAPPHHPGKDAVAGEAYLFLGMISMLSFDYRFTDYFKKADACLPNGSALIDRRLNFSDGNYMLMIQDPAPGEATRFVDAVMEAMPYGVKAMNGAAYGVKYVTKAETAYYVNDMNEAEASAYRAIYQAEQNGQYDVICAAYFVLLRVYFKTGDSKKADLCLRKLEEIQDNSQREAHANHCMFTRDIMKGWYYARLGVKARIPEWILRSDKRGRVLSPNNSGRDQFIRAYCLLQDGNYAELHALLETLDHTYNARRLLLARIEVRIYRSIAAHKTGAIAGSMAALREAYDLAVGNELTMPFIEMGKYIRAVIYAAQRSEANTVPREWLETIYAKAITYEKQLNHMCAQYAKAIGAADASPAQLTHAEKETLRYLCRGLTVKEISANLYISASTAKKRLTSVYNKLGAANRADAVRIATQLGLQ